MKEWKVFKTDDDPYIKYNKQVILDHKILTRILNNIEECGWHIQSITKEEYGIHYIYAWKKKRIDIEEHINMKGIEGLARKEY